MSVPRGPEASLSVAMLGGHHKEESGGGVLGGE